MILAVYPKSTKARSEQCRTIPKFIDSSRTLHGSLLSKDQVREIDSRIWGQMRGRYQARIVWFDAAHYGEAYRPFVWVGLARRTFPPNLPLIDSAPRLRPFG